MAQKNFICRFLFSVCIGLCTYQTAQAQQWNPNFLIGTSTGSYNYSYNQTPDQLVDIYPAAIPNTGLTYQWEQSLYPTTAFTPIQGATSSSYSFTVPLAQTQYYRKRVTSSLGSIYSNTVKITVVSINWEDNNYIREHDVLTSGITNWQTIDQMSIGVGQKLQTTTYVDGLGRTNQKISRETATPAAANSLWGDLVQFSQYDALGREPIKYLPYTTTNQSGKLKTSPITDQSQYYTTTYNETSAFTSVTFDNSPVNRVTNIKEPGAVWAASAGKSAKYDLNGTLDNVQQFKVDYVQGDAPINYGAYPINALLKTTSIDEYNKQVVEYTDGTGKLILRKVQLDDVPTAAHAGWICTYNVYDEFGLLRFQIQPEAVKYLDANGWTFATPNGAQVLAGLCFQYNYDDKGRMIWKKAPGAAPLNMVYDSRDRVVFMQDGNQAAMTIPQWTTNLYDDLDRPTLTALYNTTESLSNLQTDIANATTYNTVTVTNQGSPIVDLVVDNRIAGNNYTAQNSISFTADAGGSFTSEDGAEFTAQIDGTSTNPSTTTTVTVFTSPISTANLNNPSVCTIVKYLFYDNYNFTNVKSFNTSFTNTTAYSNADPNVLPIVPSQRTLSYPTGSMVRVLGTNTFLGATEYYDEKGRHIQTLEDNIRSGIDITTTQHHFDGRLLSTCSNHTTPYTGFSGFITLTKYLFDKLGRVTTIQKQFGTNTMASVATYDYDDVGRVKTKHLDPNYSNSNNGGSIQDLESLNYSFNIHNQITGINKDYALKNPANYNKWGHFFGLYLGFDNKDNTFANARLNGQVAGLLWNTQGDDAQRKYDYTYDNAGRLTVATYNEKQHLGDNWDHSKMDFTVSGTSGQITYDLNGNLLTLLQKGVVAGTAAPITIDDLRYKYNTFSNQLQSVTDQMTTQNLNGQFGDFKDGSNADTPDYVYDANGNLVIDLNKNVQTLNGGTYGITYNFLDKPEQIRIVGKGTIKIVYSADGEKLQRSFMPENGGTSTTTTYINQFVYQSTGSATDQLGFINFEEGRIRSMQAVSQGNGYDALIENGNINLPNGQMGAYDYFVRDYQQNVRMILTEETHVSSSTCTMETARASIEDGVFGQTGSANEVETSRIATPSGWSGNTTAFVSRLGNSVGVNLGPNTLQKVMAGDQVNATVLYYHNANATAGSNNLLNNILGNLLSTINAGSGNIGNLAKGNGAAITSNLNSSPAFTGLVQQANGSTGPKAYLTVLFFDERFNFIAAADGGAAQQQVAASVSSNGAQLVLANIKAPKNGYAYVYVSNQSDQPVYFDNLQVGITAGNIIEENHYYAYGLKIAGISSKKLGDSFEGLLKNNNLYNDKELFDDGDLSWYDYGFRNYDPQIGRFVQLDPLTDSYPELTPYQYASNDPITNIDIDGLEGGGAVGGPVAGYFTDLMSDIKSASIDVMNIKIAVKATDATLKVANEGSKVFTTVAEFSNILYSILRRVKAVDDTKQVGAAVAGGINKFLSFQNEKNNEVAYFESGDVVSTTTDFDVDTDGDISDVPKSEIIKDKFHLNSVASGQRVNPYSYSYDVLPDEQKYLAALRSHGVKIRGVFALVYKGTTTFGTHEDTGPAGQSTNGEGSVHLASAAGIKANKNGSGGVDDNSVQFFYFKNSEQHFYKDKGKPWYTGGRSKLPTPEQVNQLGQFLLDKYKSEVDGLKNHMNKNVKHVKIYD
ncbi:DUF6443 domain-containing protein [Parasediminibacterium paludis]|uniref:DUF6443 domain-containing protein n=1 Tax=Parasediminibacterium paludis TaxID=908966 RepID=A0ABV8PU14_9BACT